MKQTRIEEASAIHLDAILDIEQASHVHPWNKQQLLQSLEKHHVWIMFDQHTIVGHMVVLDVAGEWELLNVAVEPSNQGKGLGRAWMSFLVEQARQAQVTRLLLEVRQSNLAAVSLYQQVGFKEDGIRKNYYPTEQGWENAVLMSLSI